jgi:hypothetical protein
MKYMSYSLVFLNIDLLLHAIMTNLKELNNNYFV